MRETFVFIANMCSGALKPKRIIGLFKKEARRGSTPGFQPTPPPPSTPFSMPLNSQVNFRYSMPNKCLKQTKIYKLYIFVSFLCCKYTRTILNSPPPSFLFTYNVLRAGSSWVR